MVSMTSRSASVNTDTVDLKGYHVVDGRGEDMGPVDYVWNDPHSHAPEFVGVHAGMLGRTHLVPLTGATIDRERELIMVPFYNDTIRNTRHFGPGAHLTSQDRWELYHDYNLKPPEPGAGSPYHADQQIAGQVGSDEDDLDTPAGPV
jgi:hypothetical protein